jgi:predicted DNA-binding transcriptional regulator AlpA
MAKRFIGYAEMTEKLGVSRTQTQRWVACGTLPKPLRLGSHKTSRTVWWEHEVEAAMEVTWRIVAGAPFRGSRLVG